MHIVWNEEDSERIWCESRDDYHPYLFEMMSYTDFTWQVHVESEGKEIRISTNEEVHGLTLMLPQLGNEMLPVTYENTKIVRDSSLKARFGLPYMEMILDLPAGMMRLELAY
jgi:hypothetical protein